MQKSTGDEREGRQFHLRLPLWLLRWLRQEAARRESSVNATVVQILTEKHDHQEEGHRAQDDQ